MRLKYVGVISMMLLIAASSSNRTVAQSPDSSGKNGELATRLIKNVALEGELFKFTYQAVA